MSDFPKLTVKIGGSSGLDIRAMPPEAFWCGEFTLRDDCPQSILIAPWIQFEPVAMAEWRQKWAYEIVRRAEIHETLVATIADLQKTIESERDMAERRYETQQMTYQMWREERAKYGLPEDFSDKQLTDWPPEMLSGYDHATPRNQTKTPEARAGDCLPVHPHVRGRTLLTLLWQKYDAGGISMGRSFESVVLEAAMDLFDDFRDQSDVNRCDGNSEVINETRTYLSQQRLLREGLTTKATP